MRNITVEVTTPTNVKYQTNVRYSQDITKEYALSHLDEIKNCALEGATKGSKAEVLIPVKKAYKKADLMRIGQEEAATWGAECIKVTTYENKAVFLASEYGDKFTFDMDYSEIDKKISA